jgi:hypothetical protein
MPGELVIDRTQNFLQRPEHLTCLRSPRVGNSTMTKKNANRSLHAAKTTKQDEFYTQLSDIEKELVHYKKHFRGKTVLCNCDDPRVSNFFKYFLNNFEALKLKKLITTCYQNDKPDLFSQHKSTNGVYFEYSGEQKSRRLPDPAKIMPRKLKADGDFRSQECVTLLRQADIIVTNPPFSLFREYVAQLVDSGKKFLCIGNQNAISYKEIFTFIKENRIWLGYTHPVAFIVPDHYEMREIRSWRDAEGTNWRSLGNACWFTNLDIAKRHEDLLLFKKYSRGAYPKYANYNAIEVPKYTDIPCDYDGSMGVPVTFLEHYNPNQFEILGSSRTLARQMSEIAKKGTYPQGGPRFYLAIGDGKYRRMYDRLVIRKKGQ